MRRIGYVLQKLFRRLSYAVHKPRWSEHCGVMLPVNQRGVSPLAAKAIFTKGYERREFEITRKTIAEDDIVMEVGAGIGFLSTVFAKHIGSERVFAYEANPELIGLIQSTYKVNYVNPCLKNVVLAQGNGKREFYIADEFWASSAHRQHGKRTKSHQLATCQRRSQSSYAITLKT